MNTSLLTVSDPKDKKKHKKLSLTPEDSGEMSDMSELKNACFLLFKCKWLPKICSNLSEAVTHSHDS